MYLSVLALADNFCLFMNCFLAMAFFYGTNLFVYSKRAPPEWWMTMYAEGLCQGRLFMNFYSRLQSVLILCAFSLERLFVIYFPLRKSLISIRSTIVVLIVTTIIAVACSVHIPFSFESKSIPINLGGIKYDYTICKINPKFLVANNLDIFMHQLVPIIVLISTTILISRKLKTRAKATSVEQSDKDDILLNRLLLKSTIFLVTSLPLVILNLIRNFKTLNCTLEARLPPYSNLLALFLNLFNTNFAVKFLIYVMTDKTFYKQAVALLRCDYKTFNTLVRSAEEAEKKKEAHDQMVDQESKLQQAIDS
ncbi:hypothetical protein Ciccas_004061 [Cichlidogyrus casuarinus]|uniref:G-protein coupled receptors family 1 profile domain-containing protein n=1 Tax=Cichlidogyrus casuarinus TaxID=1844966 RepID=A0ABD2QEX4_9PLAT